jgi:hypothetical protein
MRVAPALAVLFLACSSSSGPALTYWRDVAPVINDKCVKCHQEGGMAPFPLDKFETVRAMAVTIASVTRDYMPPFYVTHDGSCGQFHDEEALTPAQLAILQAWPKSGLSEGTRTALVKPIRPGLTAGDDVSTPAYAPRYRVGMINDDDRRCFSVEGGAIAPGFITAYDVLPGQNGLAGDVTVYLVDPARPTAGGSTNAQVMQALDAADPAPGWSCLGTAGDGLEVERIAAVHGPGQGAVLFPPGMGIPQGAGHRLVIAVHYQTNAGTAGQSEVTTVRLVHGAATRALRFVMRDPFIDTLGSAAPASLPPGQSTTSYTWSKTAAELGVTAGGDLVGIMPHMQVRGLGMHLAVGDRCAAQVPEYFWGWQRVYLYREPYPRLEAGTALQMECRYTTSQDDTPVAPGWTSRDEMCTAILLVAE